MNDDHRLLEAARRGDRTAAGAFFDRHFDAVYRHCRAFPRVDHDDAMDLAQTTLLRALDAADTFRDGAEAGPWLRTIARNLCTSRQRLAARRADLTARNLDAVTATATGQGDETRARARDVAVVRRLVADLEDGPIKEVAVRFYSDDEPTIEELAGQLGLPRGTVSARLTRLRGLIKTRLLGRLVELRG